ncbi:MAG TPA: FadD3 family acyl-CoA ligase [Acidimicrobiia bacterium]|nr:FadD3 family acyl-CoA ligase [Acidimicrobiia bacterium]
MTIPKLAADAAQRFDTSVAIVDGETRLTFAELLDRARSFGAALVASGIATGDRVAIWAPNSASWIVAVLGIWEAGAVLVPVNTRFKGAEAGDILQRSRARALFTVDEFLGADYVDMLATSGFDLPELSTIVLPATWAEFVDRGGAEHHAEVERRAGALTSADVSDILFTSGTTGVPKGVVQTHAGTLGVANDFVAMTGLAAGDRYLMVNPYFHMFGLKAGILAALSAGATMLPVPVFDVEQVLRRVGEERITALPGPPTVYQSILAHPERDNFDLSSLRIAVTGAAEIPVELIRRIHDELPFETIIAGYGLTEAGTACATGPDDDPETIATTVGRARPGFVIRIADGAGAEIATGEVGEVLLRGPTLLSHYLDDPAATAKALPADGWLRTGDLGVLDDRGCLRIVGRSKDMFIVGGFNAYPAEIENLLLRHPDIRAVAVIGVPDVRLGEVGMAFVVLRPGAQVTGADIIGWSREQMANYKVPRAVEVLDDLPLNATGKVMKDVLRARAATPT